MYNQNEALMNHENFVLPAMVESDFTPEELAEDMEGMQMSFQRVKIPSGGMLQFELPSDDPDNPDYAKNLEGVILYNHSNNAYWAEGNEYDDNTALSAHLLMERTELENLAVSALPVRLTSTVRLPKEMEKPAKICGFFIFFEVAIICRCR